MTTEEVGELLDALVRRGKSRVSDVIKLVLSRMGCPVPKEDFLILAIGNHRIASEIIPLLLANAEENAVTEEATIRGMKSLNAYAAQELLACVDTASIVNELLEAAAQARHYGGELTKMLLKNSGAREFPKHAFVNAINNDYENGEGVILALEEYFGPIAMTTDEILSYIDEGAMRLHLLRWIEPHLIDERLLIAAMDSIWEKFHCAVVERSLHLPITLDIIEAAAHHASLPCFQFLWNHASIRTVPESLIQKAIQNTSQIFEFLLDKPIVAECGEQLLEILVVEGKDAYERLKSLIQRKIALDFTPNVLRLASANFSPEHTSIVELVLQQNPRLVVSDEILQEAAYNGNVDTLHILSRHRGMESPLQEWLDIAAFYWAVDWGVNTTEVKNLLESGVNPDITDCRGRTPLYWAVQHYRVTPLQILLSAGAKPDPIIDQETPLCWSAYTDRYKLVKILVEAGASLDFKDKKGRTPAMIARREGHMKVFRYLEQCEKDQKEAREKAQESTPNPESLTEHSESSQSQLSFAALESKETQDDRKE